MKQGKPKRVRSSTDKDISKLKTVIINRKAKKAKTTQDDPYEEYLTAACAIACCVDLFCKVNKLIKIGCLIQQEEAAENGELDESEADRESRKKRLSALSSNTHDRYTRNYQQLLQLAPGIRSLINDHTKAKELAKVTQKMNTVLSATRSDDAARLKSQIGHYVVAIPSDGSMKPAFYTSSSSKTHLGINHPILASFLCPISQLAVFNGDKVEGQKKLLNGKIAMFVNNFPAFLWSREPPGRDYDDEAMAEGLLWGYLLERVMRHIFTGPSTALGNDSRATPSCNAVLHDMTTVEAEHIAYGCVQVRFGISSCNKWAEIDGQFNYREFYYNIIDFIRDGGDKDWVEDLRKWWNETIFKNEDGREGGSEARVTTDERGGSQDSCKAEG
ncbi:hypothetical protein F4604DRAFT_1688468 [Suillus subluteus]|nr:hypothetical protein F4604DRAFT_1688468 [Suillus subluteus]